MKAKFSAHFIILGLLVIGLAIGLLILPPNPRSVDEYAMVATSVTLSKGQGWEIPSLTHALWAPREGESVVMRSADGEVYTKKSPAVILLLVPFVWLGRLLPQLNVIQSVLLGGVAIYLMTILLVYKIGRTIGYSARISALNALILAVATIQLPYAQTIFGEPLAGIGWLLVLWGMARSRHQTNSKSEWLCGAGLGLIIGCNFGLAILVVPVAIFLFLQTIRRHGFDWQRVIGLLTPLLIAISLLALYNWVRFGTMTQTGYHFGEQQEGFTTPTWFGVVGLLFSPARGLFWYSPTILLSLLGAWRFGRGRRELSFMIAFVTIGCLVIFGSWWQWWGGWVWGPRFLVPAIPLLALPTLGWLEQCQQNKRRKLSILWTLCIVSWGVITQLAGTAYDYNEYEGELDRQFPAPSNAPLRYHHDPSLIWDVARSPIIAQLRRLGSGEFPQWQGIHRPITIPPILTTLPAKQGDAILSLDATLLDGWMEVDGSVPPLYTFRIDMGAEDEMAQAQFAQLQSVAQRIWLLTWSAPGDPLNWYEKSLWEKWVMVEEQPIGGLRRLLFIRPMGGTVQSADLNFGPFQLESYQLFRQEEGWQVTLNWAVEGEDSADYTLFLHLVDETENVLSQQDSTPFGKFRPTSQWQKGERLTTRHFLALPTGAKQATSVRLGWYQWPTMEHLMIDDQPFAALPIPDKMELK